jgi:hypothetical protein
MYVYVYVYVYVCVCVCAGLSCFSSCVGTGDSVASFAKYAGGLADSLVCVCFATELFFAGVC